MTRRGRDIDYGRLTRWGLLLGVALFAVGVCGQVAATAGVVWLPRWGRTLLFDAEVLGVLVALLSPFVFGVALPLTE